LLLGLTPWFGFSPFGRTFRGAGCVGCRWAAEVVVLPASRKLRLGG
jgi:hypothetical protein